MSDDEDKQSVSTHGG